jgi:hypothetical protein
MWAVPSDTTEGCNGAWHFLILFKIIFPSHFSRFLFLLQREFD